MTWPAPDVGIADRMRSAARTARTHLGLHLTGEHAEAWGWHGRTYGQPARTSSGCAVWLRVAGVPCTTSDDPGWDSTFWTGAASAQQTLPASIPRPALQRCHEWEAVPWRYRAEVHDRAGNETVAGRAPLTYPPALSHGWWQALRTATADLTAVATSRYTIHQHYLDWVMPRFLGETINTTVPVWKTSHGDLHWANLCAPTLIILDWEGWGLAPAGYDAAILHTYSLLVPDTAAQVRSAFADILDGPHGRFAELAAIAELLHAASRGDLPDLAIPMRQRAATLLGRDIPGG